ncbi:MAG: hypothetical protein Q9168_007940, partial [Polycauliona sp. 1 TL-2023]
DVTNATQIVFVDSHSQLRFNPPGIMPDEDAKNATFSLTQNPIPAPGSGFSALTFSGVGRSIGYLACPIPNTSKLLPTVYEVFVDTPSLTEHADEWVPTRHHSDCIGFDAFATEYTSLKPAAYQYE